MGAYKERSTTTASLREPAMPFVNVRLAKELIADDPGGKKAALGKRITQAITETTGVGENEIWIVFEEVPARNWYVGPTDVETMKFRK
jgi:4-oxalocrotonate tautomerase